MALNATIMIVDDERSIRVSLEESLRGYGYDVVSSDGNGNLMSIIEHKNPDLVLLDMRLEDKDGLDILKKIKSSDQDVHIIMMTGYADVQSAVEAMKCGAMDYIHKPFNHEELHINIQKSLETRSLKKEVGHLRHEQRKRYRMNSIIGESSAIRTLNALICKIAQSQASSVLIQGESGTGKSLVARVIHHASTRSDKPFVEVNCTALPETLLESELFGHEKGAFTDAKRHKDGLFEMADGGTLFLDEIGDMTLGMQAKLLRAIEERSFRRVGGVKDITVDIRIITATNKDLEHAVNEGRFREDLYYRLKVMPIYLVPLRERKEDVSHLVKFFIKELNRDFKTSIAGLTPEAEDILRIYDWPGNVREVRNVIERAIILEEKSHISRENLLLFQKMSGKEIQKSSATAMPETPQGPPSPPVPVPLLSQELSMDAIERKHILRILEDTNWNRNKTARILKINRTTLYNKIDKYNLYKRTPSV